MAPGSWANAAATAENALHPLALAWRSAFYSYGKPSPASLPVHLSVSITHPSVYLYPSIYLYLSITYYHIYLPTYLPIYLSHSSCSLMIRKCGQVHCPQTVDY